MPVPKSYVQVYKKLDELSKKLDETQADIDEARAAFPNERDFHMALDVAQQRLDANRKGVDLERKRLAYLIASQNLHGL